MVQYWPKVYQLYFGPYFGEEATDRRQFYFVLSSISSWITERLNHIKCPFSSSGAMEWRERSGFGVSKTPKNIAIRHALQFYTIYERRKQQFS
jgi:hypothetical protein